MRPGIDRLQQSLRISLCHGDAGKKRLCLLEGKILQDDMSTDIERSAILIIDQVFLGGDPDQAEAEAVYQRIARTLVVERANRSKKITRVELKVARIVDLVNKENDW